MSLLEAIKKNGMRKMAWALAALLVLALLAGLQKLGDASGNGVIFKDCFIALSAFVMGANYGEHREKAKAASTSPIESVKAAP